MCREIKIGASLERAVKLGELATTILTAPISSWAQNGKSYVGEILKTLERQEEDDRRQRKTTNDDSHVVGKCRICDVETVNGGVTSRVGCGYQDETQSMLYTMRKMQQTKQYHLILDSSVPSSGSNI